MSKNLECVYCNSKFSVQIHANFTVICPCCNRSIYLECEYGFGPVTPCQIYWGEKVVGIVESEHIDYYLKMNGEKINLHSTYMDAIPEAEEIVKKRLNISRPSENIRIITEGGSLCFYGDWFGRPYDNYHKITKTSYDGEILEIHFDQFERLLIYEPENITSTKKELVIAKAKKVKWLYIPYGTGATQYKTITYTLEKDILSKETEYGISHPVIKAPFVAVQLCNY